MQVQDRYFDAAIAVLDWDIPEDSYSEAVNAQANHLAGCEDDWRDSYFDITVH
ncbi:MAG: hypothetical protein KAX57_01295 [Rhodoferax sp.]|jgi:hypothetical protein|uniref:hypothetical protein n=1 Tax=Rhodoferax sp. TaxID=50421 RepID=UPI001B57B38D|nr:hypothetical protein [Rhodoferax sp.]MBP8285453.1 hypothetical protein [Rhodoferax sp.]MBP9734289.1 hypothetical protein [Rhodoferax sp.]